MHWTGQFDILGRVVLAGLLGGLIGLEREWSGKPAGLRTHICVALAAALLMSLGPALLEQYRTPNGADSSVRIDASRIVHAIVTGISFLGAGTIINNRGEGGVAGLTTAASILLVAVVGIAAALQQYVLATGVTVLTIFVLSGLGRMERSLLHMKKSVRGGGEQTGA